ncbi:MAG: EutN/CcmL family microcompartment protein [Bacillota bacterium]
MFKGKVVGSLVATVKHEGLKGIKLLAVQTYRDDKPDKIIIAADGIGVSGEGDLVYLVRSREAGMAFKEEYVPIDAGIVGVIDKYESKDE